jgi:hypothetical protein
VIDFRRTIADCGHEHWPGRGLENLAEIDCSRMDTSLEQTRLDDVLVRLDLAGRSVLHVGIGNSSLAARLAGRGVRVDGITVSLREKLHADALRLPGYHVLVLNKHTPAIAALPERYDYIVDSHLTGFMCCERHFDVMLRGYVHRLAPGGRILTDEEGLAWTVDGNREWKLTFDDLEGLSDGYSLRPTHLTQTVIALDTVADQA